MPCPMNQHPPILRLYCVLRRQRGRWTRGQQRGCAFSSEVVSFYFIFLLVSSSWGKGTGSFLLSCKRACTLFIIVYFMYFFGIVLFFGRQGFWKTNSKVLQFLWGRVRVLGDWWKEKQMKRRNIRWVSIERLKNHGKLR